MSPTIWELINTALTPLGVPMAEGSYIPGDNEAYPDLYMVYFMVSLDPELFADDQEIERTELVQVSIYKRDSLIGLPDVIGAMKAGGFTFSGGRELDYDPDTRHHAIAFDFEYLENL